MMDSLPYRNDAAIVFRRLIRSLPRAQRRDGRRHLRQGPARDDDGPGRRCAICPASSCPAASRCRPRTAKTPARSRRIGVRFAHGKITLEEAAELGCRACASPGGGCQFLGTAATAQVVGEALGLSLPHSALAPSGQPIWLDMARALRPRAAATWKRAGITTGQILTPAAVRERDGGPRRLRRLDQPAAAHPGHRPRRRPAAADGRGLDRRQPQACRAWSTRCPTARSAIRPSASSSPAACPKSCSTCASWACSHEHCLTATGEAAGRSRSTGGRRPTAARGLRDVLVTQGRRRPRRRDHVARAGAGDAA